MCVYCKLSNGDKVDLKERLISNTCKLMKDSPMDYSRLVDYNRGLFYELYGLDIFIFIDKDIVEKYCKDNPSVCRKQVL